MQHKIYSSHALQDRHSDYKTPKVLFLTYNSCIFFFRPVSLANNVVHINPKSTDLSTGYAKQQYLERNVHIETTKFAM